MRMGQGVRTGLGHGGITCVLQTQFSSFLYFSFKDCLPHLFHGFRNKYFNKISLDNMLYFHD